MRTDELIRALAADDGTRDMPPKRGFGVAVPIGFAVAAALFLAILGPRPDIAAALATARFAFKIVEALLLAGTALLLAIRLSVPGAPTHGAALAMLAAPVLLATAVATELLILPVDEWAVKLVGTNARVCLLAIPFLSLPLLGAALYALRSAAPTRPALAGAAAGFAASGFAASLYAIHCPDNSPLFVATWYGLAIAAVSLVAAIAGRHLLRW